VFVVIFGALGIPPLYQHRVLFWGILSALVLRGAMIAGGAALLERFHWIIYVFGAFLILTGVKLFLARGASTHPEHSAVFRLLRRFVPASARLDGNRFFTVEGGRRVATPLFFALAMIELTDVVFAVDSIPAIFAVTRDPYIVFTSNVFAILGLRSLYFLLASFVERFVYLKPSLAVVLVFVGAKMTVVDVVAIPPAVSLAVIVAILATGVAASIVATRRAGDAPMNARPNAGDGAGG
jgi:tellurite resistance protein TerC